MSVSINGSAGLTFNDGSTQNTSPFTGGFAMRNRIINGDMRIDQRNAGASVTPADGAYTLDRWNAGLTQASKFSVQRSTVAPVGFTNSLLVTSLSSYSVGAGDLFRVSQYIEGFNAADFAWGTASAATVTLSFLVRSSLTGTFSGSLMNSAANRAYPFTYTISAANTFETKTITIPGDTSGTWLTDSGIGIRVGFSLGAGSTFSGTAGAWASSTLTAATGAVSVVGTNGATFYVTGVDLQKGSTATSFDYRPYGTELALCERYGQQIAANIYIGTGSGFFWSVPINFQTTMRAAPTVGSFSGGSTGNISSNGAEDITAQGLRYTIFATSTNANAVGRTAFASAEL